jgi:hypothetical protein
MREVQMLRQIAIIVFLSGFLSAFSFAQTDSKAGQG